MKRASVSPTQRSLAALREQGWHCEVVEKWNHHARIRQDLFGFADLLALRGAEIMLVQVTSGSNVAARVRKITEHENLPRVREANMRVVVHGWRKDAKGVVHFREVDLS